jgi:hypothetical protein
MAHIWFYTSQTLKLISIQPHPHHCTLWHICGFIHHKHQVNLYTTTSQPLYLVAHISGFIPHKHQVNLYTTTSPPLYLMAHIWFYTSQILKLIFMQPHFHHCTLWHISGFIPHKHLSEFVNLSFRIDSKINLNLLILNSDKCYCFHG